MENWVTLLMSALRQRKYTQILTLFSYVYTHVLVAHSLPRWIVTLGAAKHVTKDIVGFVDYIRVLVGRHYVILGNISMENVLGVWTYQLKLLLRHTLLLYDVSYALGVHCNLFSVITLLELGFKFHFVGSKVEFYLNKTYMDKVFYSMVYLY